MAAMIVFRLIQENLRAERRLVARVDPLEGMNEMQIFERYRFGRNGLHFLEELVGNTLERPTRRSNALTPLHQILITLRFYASGSFQQVSS